MDMASVIRRNMKVCDSFTVGQVGLPVDVMSRLGDGERLVGWYRNDPECSQPYVLFTDRGLIHGGADADQFLWAAVSDHEIVGPKSEADLVRVHTDDGQHDVRVEGAVRPGENARSAFNLGMILFVIKRARARGAVI